MTSLGRYRIVNRIASGGMADVYRAVAVGEDGFEKEVVLKRVRPELAGDPRFDAMFVEEARLAAALSHANIVQVLDFGRADGECFIVMESVRGRDLRQVLERLADEGQLLPIEVGLFVGTEVARALDYAHRRRDASGRPLGIVHRDVSPHNVLVSFEGEVKLTDFGIAKLAGSRGQTEAGAVKGKAAYMSPEQASGSSVDQRSDIFSFGALLYHMLVGRPPFEGQGFLEVLERVRSASFERPLRRGEPLPRPLEDFVVCCLSREPERRPRDAAELVRALRSLEEALGVRSSSGDLAELMRRLFTDEAAPGPIALDRFMERELRLEGLSDEEPAHTAVLRAGSADAGPASGACGAGDAHRVAPRADGAAGRVPAMGEGTGAGQGGAARPATSSRGLVVGAVGAALLAAAVVGAMVATRGSAGSAADAGGTLESGAALAVGHEAPDAGSSPAGRRPDAGAGLAAKDELEGAPSSPAGRRPDGGPPTSAESLAAGPGEGRGKTPSDRKGGSHAVPAAGSRPRGGGAEGATLVPRRTQDAKERAAPVPGTVASARRGFVRFRTEPAYAEVWVAGKRLCTTPCVAELPWGASEVTLSNPQRGRQIAQRVVVGPEHTRDRPAEVTVRDFR